MSAFPVSFIGKSPRLELHFRRGLCYPVTMRRTTAARHPQTNGICERFHKTILHEFYEVAFRRKKYKSLDDLQGDLDEWLEYYNNERTHQGKMCCGRTPMQTFLDGKKNLGGKGRTVEFI